MGAKERILTLRLLEKLAQHPRWCSELGLETAAAEGYRDPKGSKETESSG